MDRKRILRVSAILAVAAGTGFVMQSQQAAPPAQRVASAVALPALSAGTLAETTPVSLPAAPAEPVPVVQVAAPATDPVPPPAEPPVERAAPESCDADMALIARPGAMLDVGLLAPCRPDQRVLIRHGGLVVTARTSAAGTLVASIPALHSPAELSIAFADGTRTSQTVEVPDLAQFDRFAVQWMADDAFQLHAYDSRIAGDAGHVSAAAPGVASEQGGFLTRVGDPAADRPLLAEVFTWPAGEHAPAGRVRLEVEASVTEATCGREILGETLQLTGGRLQVRDLTIAMPDCSAIGEYVVLQNPVAPETLAAN
ncbi:MAG: hypothetical protein ACK4S2_13075 [Gemmobacter sp.]|uniref:hypothetical protein n=1 Tax=Gemmobacter sp. TaxID=1898957 RepID=UPI00391D30DE